MKLIMYVCLFIAVDNLLGNHFHQTFWQPSATFLSGIGYTVCIFIVIINTNSLNNTLSIVTYFVFFIPFLINNYKSFQFNC